MAPHAQPERQSTSSTGWKGASRQTAMRNSQLPSSSTYENAKTAASRAFQKFEALPYSETGQTGSTRLRNNSKKRHGNGAGSHFAKRRSQEIAKKARRTRSSDLPRLNRSSCGTPSTDFKLRHSASHMFEHTCHSFDNPVGTNSPTLSKGNERRKSPVTNILARCRSALSISSLYKAGERTTPSGKLSDRDVQATPISRNSNRRDSSPIRPSDGELLSRARDQYLQDYRSGVVRRKRSIIPVFSKTLKKEPSNVFSSTAETVCEVVSHDFGIQPQIKLSVSEKAKRVSRSFKKKMSKFFHYSPRQKQGMLAQQIDSPHIHFGSGGMTNFSNFSGNHILGDDTDGQHDDLLRRVSPLILNSDDYDKDARMVSVSDGAMPIPNKSRVTSWNDSSEQSTRGQPGGRLLSVVKEQDESCQTLSFRGMKDKKHSSNSPKKFPVHLRRSKGESSPPADIKRLFAAVQHRIQNSDFNGSQINVTDLLDELVKEDDNGHGTVRILPSAVSGNEAPGYTLDNAFDADRRSVVSPSIYSSNSATDKYEQPIRRPFFARADSYGQKGTAWIDERRSVLKHEFQKSYPQHSQAPIMTSNEWRVWTSGETSELDKKVSSLRLRSYNQPLPLFSGHRALPLSSRQRSNHSNRPPETPMNDRFPMIGHGADKSSTNSSSLSLPKLTYGADPAAYLRSRNREAFVSLQRSDDNLAHSLKMSDQDQAKKIQKQGQRHNTVTGAAGCHDKAACSPTTMDKPTQVRKSVDNVLAEKGSPFWDDNVLRAIRRGPYASPSPVPSLSSSDKDSPIKVPKRRQTQQDIENVSPLSVCSSKRTVEDFLKTRVGDKENCEQVPTSSPPAYV